MRRLYSALLVSILSGIFATGAAAQTVAPLSKDELAQTVELLIDSNRLKQETRIARVALAPAGKATPSRRVKLTLLERGGTFDVTIDLDRNRVVSWQEIPQGRAPILSEEWARATAALKNNAQWRAAMARRGYTSFEDVFCESLSAGYFPHTPSARQRVLKMPCYDVAGATTNIYGRPIEGLVATVDAWSGEVVALLDEGVTPLPPVALAPPQAQSLPEAPGPEDVLLEDNRVAFGPWHLGVRLDDQFGLIVSDVTYQHHGERRSILSEGHVSEIFVPYMDPTESWAFRTYLDAGEFGLGTLTSPLLRGVDCPQASHYLSAATLSPLGRIIEKDDVICIFSRDLAMPLWRHYEALNGMHTGMPGQELVVRSIASIAHYDYIMDWVFRPQGDIEIAIGATGIDAVKAVDPTKAADRYGRRVTPALSAVYHDHFFSLRLDVDIDGTSNTLVRERVTRDTTRDNALKRSFWYLQSDPIMEEAALAADGPGVWRIESAARQNATGAATAYQLMTDHTVSVLAPDDQPQHRAAFSANPLWVTRYVADERAAAGSYPNQSDGGQGLPAFVDGQSINDADLVLWPTLGFRHITRPEDWPILSTVRKSVVLRPYGFFDANPTVPGSE